MAGCSGGPSVYASAGSLLGSLAATGHACRNVRHQPGGRLARDRVECSLQGSQIAAYTFASQKDLQDWLLFAHAYRAPVVVGPDWLVVSPSRAVAQTVATSLHGNLK